MCVLLLMTSHRCDGEKCKRKSKNQAQAEISTCVHYFQDARCSGWTTDKMITASVLSNKDKSKKSSGYDGRNIWIAIMQEGIFFQETSPGKYKDFYGFDKTFSKIGVRGHGSRYHFRESEEGREKILLKNLPSAACREIMQ